MGDGLGKEIRRDGRKSETVMKTTKNRDWSMYSNHSFQGTSVKVCTPNERDQRVAIILSTRSAAWPSIYPLHNQIEGKN